METGFLVGRVIGGLLIASIFLVVSGPTDAKERHEIRFYKINKDEISQRLRFTTRKSRKPGCHNLLRKARLHRTVQFGYAQCRVYSKKSCAEGSEMSFYRDKEPEPTTELIQGYSWFPVGEHKRGEIIRSWYCE